MPIAFDPPASAPHGTLPTRAARTGDDDDVTTDIFTQLLLAAAGVQEAAAPLEAAGPSKGAKTPAGDTPVANVDPMVMLPLPPAVAPVVQPSVTIVATERRPAEAREPVAIASISSRGTAAAAAAMPATMTLPAHFTDATTALPIHTLASKPGPEAALDKATDRATAAAQAQPEALHDTPGLDAAARPALSTYGALSVVSSADATVAVKPVKGATIPGATAPAPHVPHLAPAPQPIVIETVNAPAFTPGWQDETVNKLAHIVLTRNERAELKLNPAELGPVNIRVEMHAGDQASILIVAASPETRSALEQSLPQLRDLLSTHGITLGQASVQDGGSQRDATPPDRPAERSGADGAPAPRDNVIQLAARRADRLVDVFA